ncbi:MAG TPA: RICIN domain-containing protein [Streptosporangiaceae bacterium]|jgi:hypothetical protein
MLLVAAMTLLAALTVGGGGVASAATGLKFMNMGLAERLGGNAPCFTAQSSGTAITQEQCTGADNQLWAYIGTPTANNPIQLQNVGTGRCMDISAFSNAAPVVQVDCGSQPSGSLLVRIDARGFGDPVQGYFFKSPFANFCLDLENGWSDHGLSLQVWQCNFHTQNQDWHLFF